MSTEALGPPLGDAERAVARPENSSGGAVPREVFESLASGVVVQDPSGAIVDANPAACRILGLTWDQMQGRTSTDPAWRAVHEDGSDFPGETHPAMVAIATGLPVRGAVMGVYKPDGGLTWILINSEPIHRSDGSATGSVASRITDITEQVLLRERLAAVDAGSGLSLGVTTRNQVTMWGAHGAGIDGRAGTVAPATPLVVAGLSAVRTVAAGEFQCAAIDAAGALYTWGLNLDGALGREAAAFESPPARVGALPALRAVALGNGYMLALTRDGTVFAWGANAAGQLGLGHLQSVPVPSPVRMPQRVEALAAGASHALALTASGDVLAWGSNNHGQLGRPEPAYAPTPTVVALPERAQAVAAGTYFSLALGNSGRVYAWGWNRHGQLGQGDRDDRRAPVPVAGLVGARAIAAGQAHAVALAGDGLYGWGSNIAGQLGAAATEQAQPLRLLAISQPERLDA